MLSQTRHQEKDEDANKGKKQHLLLAKSRALKDGKMIPNLVFKIEAFERDIIKLTKRCGVDLFGEKYPKISTSRDFRVKEINKEDSDRTQQIIQSKTKEMSKVNNDSEDTTDSDEVRIFSYSCK